MPPRSDRSSSPEKRAQGTSTAAPAATAASSPAAPAVTQQHPSDAPASRGPKKVVFHVPEILVSELDG